MNVDDADRIGALAGLAVIRLAETGVSVLQTLPYTSSPTAIRCALANYLGEPAVVQPTTVGTALLVVTATGRAWAAWSRLQAERISRRERRILDVGVEICSGLQPNRITLDIPPDGRIVVTEVVLV